MRDLRKPEKRYRPEIEGIRTIATLLIAVYHIWFGRVSGGVDVFFILSGFLITMSLLSRIERMGTIKIGEFLLGLSRRLFPQALLVVVVIGGFSLLFLPQIEWGEIITHMTASILYFENWRLAFDAVDYLAQDNAASPFQHYWSLGVQGQIYIIWPILLIIVFFLAQKVFKTPVRKTFLVALFIICTSSISYSVYQTNQNQPWAYFDTFARVWEFGVGGLLALLLPYLVLNKWVNTLLGWLGLSIVCLTGVLLPVSTVFPGYLALVPISGVVLLIIASENRTRFGVERILRVQPLLFLGGLTYGIYLWHWPLLLFYQSFMNTKTVPLIDGVIILAVTVVLSFISTKVIEAPVLKMDSRKMKGKVIALLTVMVCIAGSSTILISLYIDNVKAEMLVTSYDEKDYPGARAIYEKIEPPEGLEPIPSKLNIKQDLPAFYDQMECLGKGQIHVKKCSFGELANPDYTVALVGGSHSGHWFPALEILAEELNFQLDLYNHDGCRFTNEDSKKHLTETCLDWNANLLKHLQENPPDLVFTTSTLNKHDTVPIGYIGQWTQLEGITTIFAVRDNPRMKKNIPSCLEKADDPLDCAITRDQGVSKVVPWENTEGIPSNVIFADLTDYFCDDATCYPVIGNIIVYRDNNHITAQYAKTLAPALKKPLQEALESLDVTRGIELLD
ncbi:acyltransferase family protein [Sporosarcina sp. JAI121]|uniref:acyltransferase family protein n=1 Tax=Sporosarcina sp. JAI121 TaxID=2723064 RepID=UPI0015CA723E|nr:acyltransferase family protein [Sporosarcina sp. JAI121]NYF23683.1 peptidoglycan/LPS O-acetylase OafA/YrhL [Sporosarcina sp. JAI121]